MDNAFPIVEFTRVYLAVFFTGVAAFYTIRILSMKRAGLSEVVFPGARFDASWWNHMLFRAFRMTIWMVCLLRWFIPAADGYLGIIVDLNRWPVVLAGDVLLTLGFLFTVLVHYDLGRQWRSGIDPGGPDKLRTDGFYRYSRNPMFVGIAVAQLGFFLALPSVFSAVCLVVGVYILRRQIRAEEAHLGQMFAADYRRYSDRVRRWL